MYRNIDHRNFSTFLKKENLLKDALDGVFPHWKKTRVITIFFAILVWAYISLQIKDIGMALVVAIMLGFGYVITLVMNDHFLWDDKDKVIQYLNKILESRFQSIYLERSKLIQEIDGLELYTDTHNKKLYLSENTIDIKRLDMVSEAKVSEIFNDHVKKMKEREFIDRRC